MAYMIDKFKGKYRLRTEWDQATNQFPRDLKGNYSDLDIYIDCMNDIRISHFGRGILESYIPSLGRGRNIIKAIYSDFVENINTSKYIDITERIDDNGVTTTSIKFDFDALYHDPNLNKYIFDIVETDEEVLFKFKYDLMEQFEKYFKPKTSAADRSPFSTKNLPKGTYVIPEEDMNKYKEISSKLDKTDVLKLGHWTKDYIKSLANKKNKLENIKDDMKRKCMKNREYIHSIGKWDEYLKYLEKAIDELNK